VTDYRPISGRVCSSEELCVTINQPSALRAKCSTTIADCEGDANGTASVVASKGKAPYTYLWPNNETTATITGLTAGTYTCTITDACGATKTCDAEVDEPDAFLGYATVSNFGKFPNVFNISCQGAADGWIDVNSIGGNQPVASYDWNPSSLSGDYHTGLGAGKYFVTITDQKGCTDIIGPINFREPTGTMTASITSTTDASCFGVDDGKICMTASGGSGNYSWTSGTWSGTGTNVCRTGLAGSTSGTAYTVVVTDNGGCSQTLYTSVQGPYQLRASSIVKNVDCYNKAQGGVSLEEEGGTPSYSYEWKHEEGTYTSTRSSLIRRKAGTYSLTLSDANGCTYTETFTITQPPKLILTVTSLDKPSCAGDSDGSVTVSASGGFGGYKYSWEVQDDGVWTDYGNHNATQNNLSAAKFRAIVEDNNECITRKVANVRDPIPIEIVSMNLSGDDKCNDKARITVRHKGGTGSKEYSWTGTTQTTKTVKNLGTGTYSVTVQDENGCTAASEDVSVCPLSKTSFNEFEAFNVLLYPNPSTGIIQLSFEAGFESDQAEVCDLQGRVVAKTALNGQSQYLDLSHLTNGTYIINVNLGSYIWNKRVIIAR